MLLWLPTFVLSYITLELLLTRTPNVENQLSPQLGQVKKTPTSPYYPDPLRMMDAQNYSLKTLGSKSRNRILAPISPIPTTARDTSH